MHLGNGAIHLDCAVLTWGLAAAGLGWAAVQLRRTSASQDKLLAAGMLSSVIFAAQTINFPVLPYASGHFLGGVLLAWVVGPALGVWCMALVLALQAIALGDGGLQAWGANVIQMGLMPGALVAAVNRYLPSDSSALPSRVAMAATATLAVPLASVLIVAEVALFRDAQELVGLADFAWQMMTIHVWVGLAEGLISFVAISILCGSPLNGWVGRGGVGIDRAKFAGFFLAACLLLSTLTPWASRLPDGYEAAAERGGMQRLLFEL